MARIENETPNLWPKTDMVDSVALSFSGTFEKARLRRENSQRRFRLAGKILLAAIIITGMAGGLFSASLGWQQKNLRFLLEPATFNLAFWTGMLFCLYFWAQIKQERLDEQKLNLMRWDQAGQKPSEIDIYDLFNGAAKLRWNRAARGQKFGQGTDAAQVSAIDLMVSLLEDGSVEALFFRLGVDPRDVRQLLSNFERLTESYNPNELAGVPFTAFHEALKLHNKSIDPLMLLCALKMELPEKHILQGIFFNLDVSLEDLEAACSWIFSLRLLREEMNLTKKLSRFKPAAGGNRRLTALPTPYLDRFSRDLTAEAHYGALPLALGRGRDLASLFTLLGNEKKNMLIRGPVGTGRATLINELAYKMAAEQVPDSLADMRLVRLETSAILGNPRRAEQTLMRALQEASRSDNIALVIPDIQEFARFQTEGGLALLELLVDFLQNNSLLVFAAATNEEYTDYLRGTANFDAVFASYELKNLNRQDILLACCIKASVLEYKNKCLFRYPAIKKAVELTDLYIKDANQPQKTVAVLVEAAARVRAQKARVVTPELIETIVSEKTHIPSQALNRDESAKLLNLEQELSKYIIGQTAALTAVASGLRRARSGLGAENRPLGSFLFLGPTGVGKTEVAKTLANIYFGEPKFLLRLDMSEYQGEQGLDKLIGIEAAKTDTPLIKHLKNYPFCLLLLDEFEKASPQVLNLFLQVLEDGRLTSGKGELIDVTHALIIATSNAGSADIQTGIKQGETLDRIKARLLDQLLLKYYPPELLNRFDGVIIFGTLSPEDVTAIVHLQLEALKTQLYAKGIKINFSLAVAKDIAEKAYDPSLGARPIRRYIQDHVETFIAKLMLQKSLSRGSELSINIKDGKLEIE